MKIIVSLLIPILIIAALGLAGFFFMQNQTKIKCYDLALSTNSESGEFVSFNETTKLNETKQWSTQYKKLNQEVFDNCVATVKPF